MLATLAAAIAMSSGDPITVLPWNGRKAAVSLTFDDGDPSHWQTAVPALNRRHLKATFFLIAGKLSDEAKWAEVAREGHEIGNHSMTHEHPAGYDSKRVESETTGAQGTLEAKFSHSVVTFGYPFTEITPELKASIAKTHIAARGGWGPSFYLKPTDQPDWFNIPSQLTLTATPADTYLGWIDTAEKDGAWTVFMIHGIEGTPWGWEPIKKAVLEALLDRLQDPQLWVAPYGSVAAYWQAEKIVEKSEPVVESGGTVYRWSVPAHFPKGVKLKARLAGEPEGHPTQGGRSLPRPDPGVYTVDFDSGELTIR